MTPKIENSDSNKQEPATFSQSYWLKNAYLTAIDRDPVDALNDANALVELLEKHFQLN